MLDRRLVEKLLLESVLETGESLHTKVVTTVQEIAA
jgi:hypothetical protein